MTVDILIFYVLKNTFEEMYVADISLNRSEIIHGLSIMYRESIFDSSILSTIQRFKLYQTEFDIYMRADLEIKFISETLNKNKPKIYKIENIHQFNTIKFLNEEAIKYEKAYLMKPFLSNPFDMNMYLICYNKLNGWKDENKSIIINNIPKIKRFIYAVLANSEMIYRNKTNQQFMKQRMYYISFFQSALIEKYESK